MQYPFEDHRPSVHPDAGVCAEATLIGDVTIGRESSVWPGAVLRGDSGPVRVGERSHVEDNCVLHHSIVGDEVMVGHAAVLNDATVENRVLIGMNSTLNRDVLVHDRCVIAPNAVIPQGREIPSESLVRGVPAEIIPMESTDYEIDAILDAYSPEYYADLIDRHTALFGHDQAPDT